MDQAGWISLPENRAARVAVERVLTCIRSGSRRREANPLTLHGPPGCGKSHLAADLAHGATASAGLTASVLHAADLPSRDPDEWEAARTADVVVVEELHRLAPVGVEALVGLVDRCVAGQRQVACTAGAGPAQLPNLPQRLTSRLTQGLVVGLEVLSPASRGEFLARRAASRRIRPAAGVIDWLAAHVPGSPRQLDGALTRLEQLHAALGGRAASADEVALAFTDDADPRRRLSVDRIAHSVCLYFQVEPDDLCSRRRSRQALLPRQVGMYLARQLTGLSLEQIGAFFGGRDHSTVLHACRKVEAALGCDPGLSGAIRQLHADLA